MNVAELIGELETAIHEAQEAGKKVQTAILALRDIFGSTSLIPSSEPAMTEPDERPRPVPELMIPCPYCGKEFPEWIRPHRKDSPHFGKRYRMVRHVAQQRRLAARGFPIKVDHGQIKSPVPK